MGRDLNDDLIENGIEAVAERIRTAPKYTGDVATAVAMAEARRQRTTDADEDAADGSRQHDGAERDGACVTLIRASELTMQPIRWLWRGWLAAGKLHVVGGAPGTGKTTLALALAATITTAGRWPDGSRCAEAGDVLIWSGEDHPTDTLLPRLAAAGADLDRVHIVSDVYGPDGRRPFDPARDVPALARACAELPRPVRMLIVDPIVSAVAGDSHKNAEVRRALAPLVDLGQKLNAAVLGITHLSKGTQGRDPLERLTGSLAFGALTRIAWATAVDREPEPGQLPRVLARIKSNIGIDGGGFHYDLEPTTVADGIETSRVVWGEAVDGDARALLATAEGVPDVDGERTERDEAADWLRATLAERAMPARDMEKLAREAGLAWRTVQRARTRAGVEIRRIGFPGATVWALPGDPVAPPDDLSRQSRQHKNAGVTGATAAGVARLDAGAEREGGEI